MMKLLEFIAGVVLIWFVLRTIQRGQATAPVGRTQRPAAPRRAERTLEATDTIRCARCGAYVPAEGIAPCNRADCPLLKRG